MRWLSKQILAFVIAGILPIQASQQIENKEAFSKIVNYVMGSIKSSPVYVRVPEILVRICLALALLLFSIIEIISFKLFTRSKAISLLVKVHPLIQDGVRLYLFLAMFAIFEQDSFRIKRGFASFSSLLREYENR